MAQTGTIKIAKLNNDHEGRHAVTVDGTLVGYIRKNPDNRWASYNANNVRIAPGCTTRTRTLAAERVTR